MLGYAAGLARGDVRITERIQQRCFTMVNVTYNRYNRCTRRQVFRIGRALQNIGIRLYINALYRRTEFRRNQFRGIRVNRLVLGCHHAHFH